MTTHTVACIDGSSLSDVVSDYAAWSAKRLNNSLVLLNVLDDPRGVDESDFSGNIGMDERQRLLSELAELEEKRAKLSRQQGHTFLEAAKTHVEKTIAEPLLRQRHGDLVDALLEIEDEIRLLVIGKQGKRGNGVGQKIGHQVERVIRAMTKPVWVVSGEFKAPEKIMIAYDHSATAKKAVDMVAGSPLFRELPVDLVMVDNDSIEHQSQVNEAAEKLKSEGFSVTTHIIQGEVESAINSFAETNQIDAIIMGAYGHSRIREFLVGSHTNALIGSAKVPLLLLR
ncbi:MULTISPECIES: universal stress protein [Gammaproteobacteria]|uniref:universal stress protein n=1 Tax=Gammaproteobacteria TaxID=1236 RepID=UPI000DD0CB86|nr:MULTISPECIES: universal stress protein [Gammaproteobacteria]RTE86697.1 universal stress protein [Aliidiomarina sp. B3213]TCZ90749.1 universal stress protein [Lysobacter sp. N42]